MVRILLPPNLRALTRALAHSHSPLFRYTFERRFGGCSQRFSSDVVRLGQTSLDGTEDAGYLGFEQKSAMGGGFSLNGAREDS